MLNQISLLQLGAIADGFFLRGGLDIGDMFVGRNTIFGVALIEAYHAESCVAKVPRIVLAASAKQFVTQRVGPRPSSYDPYVKDVLRDEDQNLFVNYLQACIPTSGEPPIRIWIDKHRSAIADMIDCTGRMLQSCGSTPGLHDITITGVLYMGSTRHSLKGWASWMLQHWNTSHEYLRKEDGKG